jgi:aspartyl-tRNA(Asn)/glutamyl-tRNA(Gln) amidotransferase subunit A
LSPDEYVELSARDIAAGVKSGRFSAEEVVRAALARIRAVDEKIGAFLTVFDEYSIQKARAVDQAVAAGKDPGPLAGVPVAVKDNLTMAGIRTTCASRMLENYVPPYTATAVQRLLTAGGIPVGKTNLDEFAMGSSTENSAFQKTRNPWDLSRVPGGSSGGSAAATAARCVPLAFGSDTGGSIRQPAAFCGVTGFKPTYGLVSRWGLVAFASSLDQVGVFARDAADAGLFLAVIAGPDAMDSTCCPLPPPDDLASAGLAPRHDKPLAGKKFALPQECFPAAGLDPETAAAVRGAAAAFRALGAESADVSLPHTEYAVATYYLIATAEASSNLARYDGVHFGFRAKDALAGRERPAIVRLYEKTRATFGPEVKRRIMLGTHTLSSGYYDAFYLKAQKMRSLIREDYVRALAQADVILSPTTPAPAFRFGEKSDPLAMYLSDIFTLSANLAALPAVSVPCGQTQAGLPIGCQLTAGLRCDAELLRWAAALEKSQKTAELRPRLEALNI